jgi:hypothetical protein
MKTLFQTVCILIAMAVLLAPLIVLAKDEKPLPKQPQRKYERSGNKIVEKVKDEAKSKGPNVVYRAGRTFPLMFAPLNRSTPKATIENTTAKKGKG